MHADRRSLARARLLVVKLGTGVLSCRDGSLSRRRIRQLARQVAALRARRRRVVLVSSGAIGAGMERLGLKRRPTRISDLQACAAVGQNLLMARYEHAFAREGLDVAQILLTHEDLRHPERRRNAQQTLLNLLRRGVVPVINENDATSHAEIKFGDNDQLAAMVAELARADACIILSNVDGFLVPAARGAWRVLATVARITPEIERHAGGAGSTRSVGGMRSKLLAARRLAAMKRPLIIANGHVTSILPRLASGELLGTIFLP